MLSTFINVWKTKSTGRALKTLLVLQLVCLCSTNCMCAHWLTAGASCVVQGTIMGVGKMEPPSTTTLIIQIAAASHVDEPPQLWLAYLIKGNAAPPPVDLAVDHVKVSHKVTQTVWREARSFLDGAEEITAQWNLNRGGYGAPKRATTKTAAVRVS